MFNATGLTPGARLTPALRRRRTLAWMLPPRDTMPVTLLAVRGMWRSSTPAWMVK